MRRETGILGVLVAVGVLPLWYVALVSGSPNGTIGLGTGESPVKIAAGVNPFVPTAGFLHGVTEVGTAQSGVVVWVALLVLVAALVLAFRFVDQSERTGSTSALDVVRVPSFFVTEHRRVLDYVPADASTGALAAIGGLTWAAVTLTCLLVYEGVSLARTQFLSAYLGGLLLTLALLVVVYAAYFVPSVTVVETREHAVETEP